MYKIDMKFNYETNKWEVEISTSEKTALMSFDTEDKAKEVFSQILQSLDHC